MNWIDRRSGKPRKRSKLGNVRVSYDGYSFASKLEASVYQILKLRMKAGEIKTIQVQDHVYLSKARIGYIADFKCTANDGMEFWIEAKGFKTDVWKLKLKLYESYGPGPLEIWEGSHLNPKLTKLITPQ